MPLTQAQKTTLKADIAANANTIPAGFPWSGAYVGVAVNTLANDSDANTAIAGWYGLAASPAFKVYRSSVPMSEIMLNGFDWTRVDNLSAGKSRIWEWMAEAGGQSIDPSKPNIRAGINAVWVGTQADLNVRAAVYLHCFADATRAQKLFATGAGSVADGNGDGPGTTTLSGALTAADVQLARDQG